MLPAPRGTRRARRSVADLSLVGVDVPTGGRVLGNGAVTGALALGTTERHPGDDDREDGA